MKALKMILIDGTTNEKLSTIVAEHFDSSNIQTVINVIEAGNKKNIIRFPYSIDHTSMIEGLLIIYYTNGLILEVSRIYVSDFVSKLVTTPA